MSPDDPIDLWPVDVEPIDPAVLMHLGSHWCTTRTDREFQSHLTGLIHWYDADKPCPTSAAQHANPTQPPNPHQDRSGPASVERQSVRSARTLEVSGPA